MEFHVSIDTRMKDWYAYAYSEDNFGERIDDKNTFQDLFDCLDSHGDVYECIGCGDSLIRERMFAKLAEIIGETYDYVYEQWMMI